MTWLDITRTQFEHMWLGAFDFFPKLLAALFVLLIGWVVSGAVGGLIAAALKKLNFNKIFDRTGWKESFEKAELKVDPAEFLGGIFKWIFVIVFLMASVEILGFKEFTVVLSKFVAWLPNVIVAVAIFVVAIILTDILEKIVKASVKRMGVGYVGLIGTAVKWAIYIFALFAMLDQLGVARNIVNSLVNGFVAMLALAFGLAFGFGGKDAAAKFIEDLKKKIS